MNAIEDAKGNVRAGGSNPETLEHERAKARRWLTKPNQDFNTVCHLAGLDPMAVRERVTRIFEVDDASS